MHNKYNKEEMFLKGSEIRYRKVFRVCNIIKTPCVIVLPVDIQTKKKQVLSMLKNGLFKLKVLYIDRIGDMCPSFYILHMAFK